MTSTIVVLNVRKISFLKKIFEKWDGNNALLSSSDVFRVPNDVTKFLLVILGEKNIYIFKL